MSYLITANEKPSILFAPTTTVQEVVQNVRTILGTIKYQIPLDREFGIDGKVVDMPIQQAQAVLDADIIRQIRRYEPRATVLGITYEGNIDGKLTPTVEVRINETE